MVLAVMLETCIRQVLIYLRSWALLEKLPIVQPLRNFPAFYGTRRFITNVHKSPPLVPILSQIDPVHTIPSYLSKIYFNIVHSPTSWSSYWSLSFWLPHQYPICIPLLSHSCYMPCPSHHPWLDSRIFKCRRKLQHWPVDIRTFFIQWLIWEYVRILFLTVTITVP
jgi:hypothetical protein